MNTMLKTEEVCNHVAAGAISAPTPGELRPLHSEIVNRAVQRERGVQLQMAEQMRLQKMKEDDYWSAVERDQGAQTRAIQTAAADRRKSTQRSVASEYGREIALRNRKEAAAHAADLEEEGRLARHPQFMDRSERVQEERVKTLSMQRKQDSFEATSAVTARKEREREDQIAEERRIASDSADLSARRDERVARDRQKRESKGLRSQRLVETTARRVEQARSCQGAGDYVAPSEVTARTDARRRAENERRREAQLERYRDYNESVRFRELRAAGKVGEPDFDNRDSDDVRAEEARMKMLNMRRLGVYQRRQAEERAARDMQERQATLSEPRDRDTMYFLWDNEY
jgi:hypothetical protein